LIAAGSVSFEGAELVQLFRHGFVLVRQCGDLFLGLNQNACNLIEKMKCYVLARQRYLGIILHI
jgi:hypothetical protein